MRRKLSKPMIFIAAILLSQPAYAQSRADIPAEYKWELSDMYATREAWENDITLIEALIPKYSGYKGALGDRESVLACLNADTEVKKLLDRVYAYASLTLALDNGDAEAQEMLGKAINIYQTAMDAASFLGPELLSLDAAVLEGYMKDPAFRNRARYFESLLDEKQHVLSEGEESLLSRLLLVSESPSDIFTKLTNVDMKFPAVNDELEITESVYGLLRENPDRDLRKAAFESLFTGYMAHNNTLAATLSAEVNKNIFFARARNYDSALESALGRDIPVSVYDDLIARANDGLAPLHRYMALRQKALGVEKVHTYDLYSPLASGSFDIGYGDAKELLLNALKPLGAEYTGVLRLAFNENWIDVYETSGKSNGAYCLGAREPHPYVLLNYKDNSVSTLAHELGHAVNDWFTFGAQPYEYTGTPVFTAEVASTVNEIQLAKYMIGNAETDAEKLYYINSLIELYRGSFYTQAMYAEFEKEIYAAAESGVTLTAKALNEMWSNLTAKYYGDAFEADGLAACAWSRIPHFYRNFYVYQYATSITAANRLSRDIMAGDVEKYIEFLSSGSSRDPITTLAAAGVDMLSPQPADELIEEFDALVTEMERLLR